MSEGRVTSRRGFQVTAVYSFWSLILAALGAPAAAYLLFPPRARQSPEWFEAAELAQLPTGVPEEVVYRRNRRDGWKLISEKATAWVVKRSETEAIAFSPVCTHLGCAYRWEEQKQHFLCPCHSSTFGLDGQVLSGPAPRPLDRHEVRIENGKLLLGPARPRVESNA